MVTDSLPRNKADLAKFLESDRLIQLEVPPDDRLRALARAIESPMKSGCRAAVAGACADFIASASDFYSVPRPEVRALAARPIRVRERASIELFGDYTPSTRAIRIWTRTAVKKQITSFGTFFSTLCHEFCHHLDCQRLGFRGSPHTRGFYERTAIFYHHARGTPRKPLLWISMPRGRWRIDWQRMNSRAHEQYASAIARYMERKNAPQ